MQQSWRNWTIPLGLGCLAIGAGWWWHGSGDAAPSPTAAAPAPFDAVHPRRVDISSAFTADASVEPWQSADLYAKVSGYLAHVNADIGDHVRAGQVLAVISLPEIGQDLAENQAQLEARQAELALQQITQKRQEELYRAHGITDQAMDQARAQTSVAQAQAKLAGASLAKTQVLSGYTRIVAPFDGVVTRRLVNQGTFVQAATGGLSSPLFTVQSQATLRVFVAVPAAQASGLRPGMPASLNFDDKPITGTVARTAQSLDSVSRTMRAEIDLPNRAGALLPGNFTRAKIVTATHPGVLAVPNGAIGSDATGSFVLITSAGKVARRAVKPGISDGMLTEIAQGLAGDETVLASAKAAPPVGTAVQTRIAP
jgi:RND family efflux transporter MFP subunit